MRVISGSLRGKRLVSFKGERIRPTSDRVKEALFNIIAPHLREGAKVADLFAGTGNLGIEALSRGAERAVFVEEDRESLEVLRKNLDLCRMKERASVIPQEVEKGIGTLERQGETFDLIFLDPPYNRGLADKTMERLGGSVIAERALVVAEHSPDEPLNDRYGRLQQTDSRRYGDTALTFFMPGETD